MKRIMVLLSIVLGLFLLSACNADFLASFGEWAGGLRDAGLVDVGEIQADKTLEAAKDLVRSIDENVMVDGPLTKRYGLYLTLLGIRYKENPTGGEYEFESEAYFQAAEKEVLERVENLTRAIAKLREVGGSDAGLRKLLDSRYEGITSSRPFHRNIYDVIVGSETYAKDVYPILRSILSGVSFSDLEALKAYDSPIPLQTYDFSLLYPSLKNLILDYRAVKPEELSPFIKTVIEFFISILPEIELSVGDRDYRTMCDELALFILFGMVEDLDRIFVERAAYGSRFGESDDLPWLLSTCGEQLDGFLCSIDAIAYLYGIESDSITLMMSLNRLL